ncbi:MAG: MotA/TolQ/ExbB proton channel family protein [Pseudomonadales bacterium]|nr:MotA/TolQ/ExbB proton channel family protein [Pseudomonadales bacterium]
MDILLLLWEKTRSFLVLGGPVLWLILLITFWMWGLILERLFYLWAIFPRIKTEVVQCWQKSSSQFQVLDSLDDADWIRSRVGKQFLSMVCQDMQKHIGFIVALVAICPLLGLFGTVLGMLEVFEVMSFLGGHNVKTMAAGVSKATVTTMAGMVAALPGIVAVTYLKRQTTIERNLLRDAIYPGEK